MITKVLSATALMTCLATVGSAATFNGDTADFELFADGFGSAFQSTALINTDIEVDFLPSFAIDVEGLTLSITFDLGTEPELGAETTINVSDLDADDGSRIVGLSQTGGNARLVSGTSTRHNSVSVDFFNFTSAQSPGSQTFEFVIETAAIPLPASLPLMLLGFGALAMNRRRKAA